MKRRAGPLPPGVVSRFAVSAFVYWLGPLITAIAVVQATYAFGVDFRATIYDPGQALLAGHSPYPGASVHALVGRPTFVYPPLLLWLDAPISLLPYHAAEVVWTFLLAGAIALGIRLAGVRDPRCYAVALLCLPTVDGLAVGNVTLLLVLGLAAAWRWRDRALVCGAVVGVVVAVKLLLWPLGVWLLFTRRFRALGVAAAVGAMAVFGSWALIGFAGLADYPKLLNIVSSTTAGPRAYSILALVKLAGGSGTAGALLERAVGLAVLAYGARVVRRRDGDRRAFSAVIVAALIISPVVWIHYFTLLLVPLALIAPRFGPAWALVSLYFPVLWLPLHRLTLPHAGAVVGLAPSAPRLLVPLCLLALTFLATAVEPARASLLGRLSLAQRGERDTSTKGLVPA
jgi:hypothetical protein